MRKPYLNSLILPVLLLLTTLSEAVNVPNSNMSIYVGRFSDGDLAEWKTKSFENHTQYVITQDTAGYYLRAKSQDAASALYRKVKIDLRETPYLNWTWRVDQPLTGLNEKTKAGDDYAARVYVIVKTGLLPWSLVALNYVWSSNQQKYSSWPNAFTSKATMVALRSNLADPQETWLTERVNIKQDLRRYVGVDTDQIDGIAVMTDSDNSGETTMARYGDIFFSSE